MLRTKEQRRFYLFDIIIDSWSQLPDCVYVNCSVTVINGWLTTLGGYPCPYYSNELFSLTREGSGRKWTKQFPPMPTKRIYTTSLCIGTALIVAGGEGKGGRALLTAEVMSILRLTSGPLLLIYLDQCSWHQQQSVEINSIC